MGVIVAAALWGFAEATLFFLVPDLLLTFVALARGLRRALQACLWAAAGAVLGGAVMYAWAAAEPEAARAGVEALPAISADLVDSVRQDLAQWGLLALILAGVTGVPYKILVIAAPAVGLHWAPFLGASLVARLARFALAVALAGAIDALLARRLARRGRLALLAGFWLVFYGAYFALMPG